MNKMDERSDCWWCGVHVATHGVKPERSQNEPLQIHRYQMSATSIGVGEPELEQNELRQIEHEVMMFASLDVLEA